MWPNRDDPIATPMLLPNGRNWKDLEREVAAAVKRAQGVERE
jgi:hypothetical protein